MVEVLDATPLPHNSGRSLVPSDLRAKEYFDSAFLALIWSDLLTEVGEADELPIADALDILGKHLKKLGLEPLGGWEWSELADGEAVESCCRVYSGPGDVSVLVFAREGICDLLFVTESGEGNWAATGLADDFERLVNLARARADNSDLVIESMDDALATIAAAHRKAIAQTKTKPVAAPVGADQGAAFLRRFIAAAFGTGGGRMNVEAFVSLHRFLTIGGYNLRVSGEVGLGAQVRRSSRIL